MAKQRRSGGIWTKLKIAIALTLIIFFVEIFGGVISGSLALFSDAGHVFMDVTALALTFGALGIAVRPATHKATFGHHRFEIVVALINAGALFVISIIILYNAFLRFASPLEVKSTEMLVVATVGFAVNLYVAWNLHGYEDLNVRSAYLHVFGDTISSLAVIVGALMIAFTSQYWVDPAASVLIASIIMFRCVRLIKESGDILMEKTPKHIDLEGVRSTLKAVDGVDDIHDLHVWSICSNVHAITAHIVVEPTLMQEANRIIREMNKIVSEEWRIQHATFQVECEACESCEPCELPHIDMG
ncbi:MAG: cation diffusion facilitator family transporter [Thermoplasmata archaeon]